MRAHKGHLNCIRRNDTDPSWKALEDEINKCNYELQSGSYLAVVFTRFVGRGWNRGTILQPTESAKPPLFSQACKWDKVVHEPELGGRLEMSGPPHIITVRPTDDCKT